MFLNQDKNNLGHWSPVTSIIDWCEPNYQHFDTVAETYNTFSSIAYIFVSFWYLYAMERLARSHVAAGNLRQMRTYVAFVCSIVVGVGTYLFHMTLLRENQMLDEISMNSLILTHIYSMINMSDDIDEEQDGRAKGLKLFGLFNTTKATITAVCCLTLFSITIAIYDTTIPVVFQTLFGLSILTGIILSGFQAAKRFENTPSEYQEFFEKARRTKIMLLVSVIVVSLIGFAVWLTDNHTCPRFEHYKLHAVWHICTAYAGYLWGIFGLHCHASNRFAKLLALGQPAVMTKVVWAPLPYVAMVKVVDTKSKSE